MSTRAKKVLWLLLAAALLVGTGQVQESLNSDRDRLGLTRAEPLENAPPVLAFTTVALGGFRGLISNFLWIRANDLQLADKYFETVQLADWITDLEPRFAQVWIFEAWNMVYNISIKFKDFADRWRWVQRGISLLRDDGLRYNPDQVLIYRELAWFFQHKMGQNLDDANMYYKRQWADAMEQIFGSNGTNYSDLLNPATADAKRRAQRLRDEYKMDPEFVRQVDERYGPLDWRLPEAQAIYWAALGLEKASESPTKVQSNDLIALRRVIYQSMYQAFLHGRLVADPFDKSYELVPNLDIVSRVNDAYTEMMKEDPADSGKITAGHRSFLRNAVYFLYEDNRVAEAAKWFKYLGQTYPDKPLLDSVPKSLPGELTLDQYAVARVQEDIGDTSQDRTTAAIEGLLSQSYYELAIGQDNRAAGFRLLASKIYNLYELKVTTGYNAQARMGLPPFKELELDVQNRLLNPQSGWPFTMRAVLRTELGLPAETNAPPAAPTSTNAPALPPAVTTATNVPSPAGK